MSRKIPIPEYQFKKGHKGYKKKGTLHLKTRIMNALLRPMEYSDLFQSKSEKERKKIKGQMIDLVIDSLIQHSIRGNTKALEILLDRTEGKVPTKVEMPDQPKEFGQITIEVLSPEKSSDENDRTTGDVPQS